jgi:DNA-directed RNA polymerase III subunit RPC7
MAEHQKPSPFPRFYGLRSRQPIPPPIAPLGRRSEKAQVTRYRALRDRIHEGPLYTILGDTVRVGKAGPPPAALFDPFLGMPTYTQKYMKQRRKIPRLDTRPYGE